MNFSVASLSKTSNSWSYKSGIEVKNEKEDESHIYKVPVLLPQGRFLFHCKITLLKTDIPSYTRPCKTHKVNRVATGLTFTSLSFKSIQYLEQ